MASLRTGKRGRKSAPLPDCELYWQIKEIKIHIITFLIDAETRDDGRIRCHLCADYNMREYKEGWVLPSSFASHSKRSCHARAVSNQQAHLAAQEEEARDDNFASPCLANIVNNSIQSDSIEITPESQVEEDLWAHLDVLYDYGQSVAENQEKLRHEFEQKLKAYGLWDGDEAPPVLPNDDMEDIEQVRETAEQAEMLAEILDSIGPVCFVFPWMQY